MDRIKILHKKDKYFPKNFLKLKDCPEFIFVIGNEKILNEISLAIVGARKASYESKCIAQKVARDLALNKIVIVSGLALGIDSEAHKGALESGYKTIAVLGNGLDIVYPKENKLLVKQIVENGGAIISEYLPGTPPLPVNLHNRNRLISALSEGIIIIEAKKKSGSLITANYARKQDKNVYVIPGSVNDFNFEGSNQLLADGAICVRNASDVYAKLEKTVPIKKGKVRKINLNSSNGQVQSKTKVKDAINTKEYLLGYIPKRGIKFQEICEKSGESVKDILTKLTVLEVSGYIKKVDNKFFKV